MSPSLASLCLASSLLSLGAVAGCSESGAPRARFADATPEQLDRAFSASTGFDLASMLVFARSYAGQHDPTGCPSIVTEGSMTTVTGGCTAEDRTRFYGLITIANLPELDGAPPADPSAPSTVEIDLETYSPEGIRRAFLGRVELDATRLQGDLMVDAGLVQSTSRLDLTCDADGICTAASGSEIEISDLGAASVEGTWGLGDPPSGRVTVRGADELIVDVARRSAPDCAPYVVGAERGDVCADRNGAIFVPPGAER